MRKSIIRSAFYFPVLALLGSQTLQAADFTYGVPPELISFVAGGSITVGLPATFPSITWPSGITVVGSLDRQINVTVVLNTSGSLPASVDALQAALTSQGWMRMPDVTMESPQNGFVLAGSLAVNPGLPVELCRKDAGIVQVNGQSHNSWFTLNLTRTASMEPDFSCETRAQQRQQQNQMRFGNRDPRMGMQRFMPRLELPDTTSLPLSSRIGGFNSSGSEVETQATSRTDKSFEELLVHFGDQLRKQGWTQEFADHGALSAQSNWNRQAEGNQQLIGMLSMVLISKDNYALKFRVLTQQPAGQGTLLSH